MEDIIERFVGERQGKGKKHRYGSSYETLQVKKKKLRNMEGKRDV